MSQRTDPLRSLTLRGPGSSLVTGHFVLLDACVVINLVATEDLIAIGQILDTSFFMVDQAATEVGYLRDDIGGQIVQTPIDLQPYLLSGTMKFLSLAEHELPQYVRLAAMVDDGEAATIAVAWSRRLQIATDDRKARRVCLELGLPEPVRSLGIMHAYADAAGLSEQVIRERLVLIRGRASFRPRQTDPYYKWWSAYVGED
jgi:predicted nucleic acid-binding protein